MGESILGTSPVMAFVATTQPEKARAFYCDLLGLRLEEETPFALIVQGVNVIVRIAKVEAFTPQPFTVLGWKVNDIEATIRQLTVHGILFERHDGMKQDDLGVWVSPSGAKIGWFKDPDGNVLSLTEEA